jgi:hypothetical protein
VAARPQVSDLQAVYFTVGGLAVSVALALAASGPGCGGGKPVIAVSYGVQNDVDTGSKGNVWAHVTYTRKVRVWRRAPNRFCTVSTYDGTFESVAGPSPGGKWELPDGIRGTMTATSLTTFRGRFNPRGAPVHGFLGTKTGPWEWSDDYFTGITRFRYTRYVFRYHATENGSGTWTNTLVGGKERSSGDIKAARR